jgi:hypothetical protein
MLILLLQLSGGAEAPQIEESASTGRTHTNQRTNESAHVCAAAAATVEQQQRQRQRGSTTVGNQEASEREGRRTRTREGWRMRTQTGGAVHGNQEASEREGWRTRAWGSTNELEVSPGGTNERGEVQTWQRGVNAAGEVQTSAGVRTSTRQAQGVQTSAGGDKRA